MTTALGLALVGRFNLISVAFIPLFVGLGVDFGIQLSVRFRAEGARAARAALAARRHGLGGSLALAATAVALGFIAFLPTAYVGVSELGIIAAAGMVVALLLNVTLLPALLVLLRPRSRGAARAGARAAPRRWLLPPPPRGAVGVRRVARGEHRAAAVRRASTSTRTTCAIPTARRWRR